MSMSDSPFEGDAGEPGGNQNTAGGVVGRLFDGNAIGPGIDKVQSDYSLPYHWALTARGFMRASTGDGAPPILEIVLGTILGILNYRNDKEGLDVAPGTDSDGTADDNPFEAG